MTYWGPLRDLPNKLIARSRELDALVSMPHRLLSDDIKAASAALHDAAEGMRQLMAGELTGCTCKRVESDSYSYLDYEETCVHHRSLWCQTAAAKKHYEEAHKKLTNELRIKLVSELIGSLVVASGAIVASGGLRDRAGSWSNVLVECAIELADTAIAELAK